MKYTLALWPNNKMMLKAVKVTAIVIAFSILAIVIAEYFWDEHTEYYYDHKGRYKPWGWPMFLKRGGTWIGGIFLLMLIMSYYQQNKKVPALGVNDEGFMMNQKGWDNAYFYWEEVASLEHVNDPIYGPGLIVHFKDLNAAINKEGQKFKNKLEQWYLDEKKPVLVNAEHIRGDINSFVDTMVSNFNKSKRV